MRIYGILLIVAMIGLGAVVLVAVTRLSAAGKLKFNRAVSTAGLAMFAGVMGIVAAFFVLSYNHNSGLGMALMISGAILFGCGAITGVLGQKQNQE